MPPITIMIKPASGLCNMSCSYCFYRDELQHQEKRTLTVMPLQTVESIIRRVMRSSDEGVHFLFQGGEPTLAGLSFYEEVVSIQQKYNTQHMAVTNAIQTNGFELRDEMITFFARNHFLVGVSLDGTKLTHDTYRKSNTGLNTWQRVRNNIDKLKAAGVETNVLCVVTKAIAQNPEAVFDILMPYQWLQFIPCLDPMDGEARDFSLSPHEYANFLCRTFDRYYIAWNKGQPVSIRTFDNWLAILSGKQPDNCAMSGTCGQSLMIESNGSVYPCDFYGIDTWCLGNVLQESFRYMMHSDKEQRFIERSRGIPDQCKRCQWFSLCRNGCYRERISVERINRWCESYQRFFAYSYSRMAYMITRIPK